LQRLFFNRGEEQKLKRLLLSHPDHHIFIISKGMFIEYFMGEDGHERVLDFYTTSHDSYYYRKTSISHQYYDFRIIHPLEITIYEDQHHEYQQQFQNSFHHWWEKRCYRDYLFSLKTVQERYEYFLKSYQNLMQYIPQYILASYLGVTPQSLSRMRALRSKSKQKGETLLKN
jgi:CRP-like cAMP-binding protein